ncbi:hypothetical protein [Salinicola rhizosphaerae]|nr:hypothetical protein [Salinicola rhizosphaerae]
MSKKAQATRQTLSDETGRLDYDIEPAIIDAIGPPALFTEDMGVIRGRSRRPPEPRS